MQGFPDRHPLLMGTSGHFPIFAGRGTVGLFEQAAKGAGIFESYFLANLAKAPVGVDQQFAGLFQSFGNDVLAGGLVINLFEDADEMKLGKAGRFGDGVQVQVQVEVIMYVLRREAKALVQFDAGR